MQLRKISAMISIHAPREGSDPPNDAGFVEITEFLSTLPARGATIPLGGHDYDNMHFYPRSPRGERPKLLALAESPNEFLSTLPARGATRTVRCSRSGVRLFLSTLPARGATTEYLLGSGVFEFLSTLPARGATPSSNLVATVDLISIHAPREGSDVEKILDQIRSVDFYPRSPRGERRPATALH